MILDRRGSAVLVVIWMTGVLAVMALTFSGRVREASQEVQMAEARLRASAMIDGEFAQLLYQQLKASQELEAEDADQADQQGPDGDGLGDERGTADAGPDASADTAGDTADASVATPMTDSSQGFDATSSLNAASADPATSAAEPAADGAGAEQAAPPPSGIQAMMRAGKGMTNTVVAGEVSLYLRAEPEMGRIDVNRGDPRVLRALLEKMVDRAVASRAMAATEKARERAGRAGAVIGAEPRPFVSVDAWIAAAEMDAAAAERVRPYLTTYTGASSVDLAFAPQELIDVLPFLSRSQKEKIAKARDRSQDALTQVLAEIAADPTTDTEAEEQGGGEPPREVMRVTVEATVEGKLRRTDRFVLAFEEGGSGAGAGLEDEQPGLGGGSTAARLKAEQAETPLPFVILDRQTLDAALPAASAAPEPAAGVPGAAS
jgi:type II secretory pathway component PulK